MNALAKFEDRTARLVQKIKMSQTPVPGFIMGLSGTDSLVAFLLSYRAAEQTGMLERGKRVVGIHYVSPNKTTRFSAEVIPWLREQCPLADIIVTTPMGGNQDQQRWADLHFRALNTFTEYGNGATKPQALPDGENFWVVGTINCTERILGTYSVLANAASMQVISSLWKSDIMAICRELGVPQVAIDDAQIPDCWCGRDELAAENIDLIDQILTYRVDARDHEAALLTKLNEYITEKKRLNDFKMRIPYMV